MKAALMVAAGWMLSCMVVQGADREFDDIVRAISDQLQARPLHIPFFGLVNFATAVAHPAGVKHLSLAVFENLDLDDRASSALAETIRSSSGDWRPFVRVRNRREKVLVYMTQQRSDCKLLVITLEPSEATVVEVKLNPESLEVWLNNNRSLRGLRAKPEAPCDECIDRQLSRAKNQDDQRRH
jgi:hypothetical protein